MVVEERMYMVEEGEEAVDFSEIKKLKSVLGVFRYKPSCRLSFTSQADLEAFVVCKEEKDKYLVYEVYGFGSDSKMFTNFSYDLEEDTDIRNKLLRYCDSFDIQTDTQLGENPLAHFLQELEEKEVLIKKIEDIENDPASTVSWKSIRRT